ncbi:Ketol-acid reductoisomerase (NAD(+)) [subsurface metagenome]
MAKIYYDKDADLTLLDGKVIGIVGYGSQGHAQAQNLRDSGCQVIVAEAEGSQGWKNAQSAGFKVSPTAEVAKEADIILMLAPDNLHRDIYYRSIEKELAPGNMLMFAHGFNIHYGQVIPPPDIDVTMIAPQMPGAYTEAALY